MADSDDDTDHRRTRDKFRRERSDLDNRHRPGEKREPFEDRAGGGYSNTNRSSRPDRRGPPDYRMFGGARDRPSLGGDQPNKRPRRDWNDDNFNRQRDARRDQTDDEASYRPPLMPFKRFLNPLDDFITVEEAMNRYREYKESFNKRYIEEFFEAHKDEEWLREKYHPDLTGNTKEQMAKFIRLRLDVFLDLFDKGMVDNQPVDMGNCRNLVKLMDAVVIKLNGGTDEDLSFLDQPDNDSEDEVSDQKAPQIRSPRRRHHEDGGAKSEEGEDSDFDSEDDRHLLTTKNRQSQSSEQNAVKAEENTATPDTTSNKLAAACPDWGSAVSSSSSVSGKEEEKSPKKELGEDGAANGEDDSYHEEEPEENPRSSEEKFDESPTRLDDKQTEVETSPNLEEKTLVGGDLKDQGEIEPSVVESTHHPMDNNSPKPSTVVTGTRHDLHKTLSIFFRCLPPSITRGELEELCRSQDGYIRLAIYDPMPERRFTRHAWATYSSSVNIKKVCWALNTSPLLREKWQSSPSTGELCATVNRDLAQRVRPVGASSTAALNRHRPVMRNDLRVASRLIAQLDTKHNLWPLPGQEGEHQEAVTSACPVPGLSGVFSANPLMRNLTDFLIDETASEEEAMLNSGKNGNESAEKAPGILDGPLPIDADESLLRALDRLIIYLRIVYSIDYYSATRYQLEDLMPHRCGIFHVRGHLAGGADASFQQNQQQVPPQTVTKREINDYIQTFNDKMSHLLEVPLDLTNEEIAALGARDPEKAAEDFIEANIQKKASKKKPYKVVWVCPLSDKKFREPVFVRKHILNKHMDKVEAAKKDNAIFFNNFLRDPKRPSLPEAPRHLIHRYYPPAVGHSHAGAGETGGDSRGGVIGGGNRGQRHFGGFRPPGGGGGFRGGYNNRNNNGPYGRRDYYGGAGDGAGSYPTAGPTDSHGTGSPRVYNDFNGRKRPYPAGDRPRPGGRSVVSYNDLDDPANGF